MTLFFSGLATRSTLIEPVVRMERRRDSCCIQHRVRRSPQPPGEAGGVAPGVVHPIANHLQREDLHRSLRCSWGQRHQRECLPPVREDPLLRTHLIFFSKGVPLLQLLIE